MTRKEKICIIGAGPAGAAAALKLERLGVPSLLIDKSSFPRDKVCGDAIGNKVLWGFNQIDEAITEDFRKRNDIKSDCWGMKVGFSNGKELRGGFPSDIYHLVPHHESASLFTSQRRDFDNYLLEWVESKPSITLWGNTEVSAYQKTNSGFLLFDNHGNELTRACLILVADGALSNFSRHYLQTKIPTGHQFSSLRAYYEGVAGFDEYNMIELHFLKELTPGYFWIFPENSGMANVGVTMRTDFTKKHQISLKKILYDIINEHPRFRERFIYSRPAVKPQGGIIPVYRRRHPVSGDHYLLLGDAARLADPFSGEGIGNAVISGVFAAETAADSLTHNNFSGNFLKRYDIKIFDKLSGDYAASQNLRRIMKYPGLSSYLLNIFDERRLNRLITAMYKDSKFRSKVLKPHIMAIKLFQRLLVH